MINIIRVVFWTFALCKCALLPLWTNTISSSSSSALIMLIQKDLIMIHLTFIFFILNYMKMNVALQNYEELSK